MRQRSNSNKWEDIDNIFRIVATSWRETASEIDTAAGLHISATAAAAGLHICPRAARVQLRVLTGSQQLSFEVGNWRHPDDREAAAQDISVD